jgi:small subunit ribosomal protein S15
VPSIDLVKKYQTHKKDTGSAEVQAVILSDKIKELAKHLRKHSKDSDSRRGLLIMVGKRRRLLNYLKKHEPKIYDKLIKDLGLKK